MALTDIAYNLKSTFSGYEAPGYEEEIERFRAIYGDAESIRIGDMDYIVINEVYKSEEYGDVPENTSPLFFNSIKNNFAIIDAETSSILIDEVYSRITYMQRDCTIDVDPPKPSKITAILEPMIGEYDTIDGSPMVDDMGEESDSQSNKTNQANIFQCQLIKDTGVSASHDAYSFMMLKGEKIREVSANALQEIQNSDSAVSMLDETNRDALEARKKEIQEAVFNKYINSDMDIQSISVKSIFEIRMSYYGVHLRFKNRTERTGKNRNKERFSIYHTRFLAGKKEEFDILNANIQKCNCCQHGLVDPRDERNIHRLHTNIDAYDRTATLEDNQDNRRKSGKEEISLENLVYAVGCEDCLTQCPSCGSWHYDYQKLAGSKIYSQEEIALVPGREFIKGLHTFEGINYCSCREGIDWVYDERSGSEEEHNIIPIRDMVFVNCANEKMAGYEAYLEDLQKEFNREKPEKGFAECELARECLNRFKDRLARRYKMKSTGIQITSGAECNTCYLCGGEYHSVLQNDRCPVCNEMFEEDKRIVTRVDGVVFMLRGNKKRKIIDKYTVTKFGNLKKISSKSVYDDISDTTDSPDASSEASGI